MVRDMASSPDVGQMFWRPGRDPRGRPCEGRPRIGGARSRKAGAIDALPFGMNEPTPPPVSLENLGELAHLAPILHRRRRGARAGTALAGILAGLAGLLAWRLGSPAIRVRHPKRSRGAAFVAAGLGVTTLAVTAWQMQRLFLPKPKHEVERRWGRFEVRRYPSVRIAETTVNATWDEALAEGFARLATFIFGENDSQRRLRMAAPVLGAGDVDGYRLAFVLADDRTTPTPNDPRVEVSDLPPRRVAVLRFHGARDASAIEAHKRVLARALVDHGLRPHGEAFFAGYDPPSTLPFLRRNELWVELDDGVF